MKGRGRGRGRGRAWAEVTVHEVIPRDNKR